MIPLVPGSGRGVPWVRNYSHCLNPSLHVGLVAAWTFGLGSPGTAYNKCRNLFPGPGPGTDTAYGDPDMDATYAGDMNDSQVRVTDTDKGNEWGESAYFVGTSTPARMRFGDGINFGKDYTWIIEARMRDGGPSGFGSVLVGGQDYTDGYVLYLDVGLTTAYHSAGAGYGSVAVTAVPANVWNTFAIRRQNSTTVDYIRMVGGEGASVANHDRRTITISANNNLIVDNIAGYNLDDAAAVDYRPNVDIRSVYAWMRPLTDSEIYAHHCGRTALEPHPKMLEPAYGKAIAAAPGPSALRQRRHWWWFGFN